MCHTVYLNSNSVRVIEFSKTVRRSTTAITLVGLTEKGIVSFTNGKNTDLTVVIVSLPVQFKVYSRFIAPCNTNNIVTWLFKGILFKGIQNILYLVPTSNSIGEL